MSDPARITIQDVRETGYCASGAKRWFEGYGFDFKAFLVDGIDIETFMATGDGMAMNVVATARARDDG